MAIFDIFKKRTRKTEDSFPNENKLETALRKAATEPASRAAFYKHLLAENLIILTDKANFKEGSRILEEDTSVNIVTLPDGRIPVFSSIDKIFEKGVIQEEVPYMQVTGDALFDLAKGATFVLNPYSDYGKELLPGEIETLLQGNIPGARHTTITVEKETPVQIGQPANYPTTIVDSLKNLFAERPAVNAAYLGWIYNPSSGEPSHLIFALDIEGPHQEITREAGYAAQQLSKPNDIIEFIQLDNSGLSNYFITDTEPFYTR
ncbi:MAG: enhanced serine sensitivity protein SseB C-terminal domain-containing protein [Rhizobacter sp.]|nr:enhanced serine sensitivity protein SseB C-terminal domain-containing protein [Ferruginibacter sp.]